MKKLAVQKKGSKNVVKGLFVEIRRWHDDERKSTLRRTLELGDLILSAVIHTGLTEYEIIKRIIEDLGELAMGVTSYNRAARMARTFTRQQQAVLVAHAVSLEKCEILAGDFYDGRARIKIVNEIKAGKIRAPWKRIVGVKEATRKRQTTRDIHGEQPLLTDAITLTLADTAHQLSNKLRSFMARWQAETGNDACSVIDDVRLAVK